MPSRRPHHPAVPALPGSARPGRDAEFGATPGGYWANRPRDVANLARFAGRQLERPINWQVVNLDNPWTDWTDIPILYLASHQPVRLKNASSISPA